MSRFVGASLTWLLLTLTVSAVEPPPGKAAEKAEKVVLDTWDAAFLDGQRAGYVHSIVREAEVDGKKVYKSNAELHLTMRRFEDVIRQEMTTGTVEDADGKVLAVSMTQSLGKDQTLELSGVVDGDQLHVKVSGSMKMDKKIPWNTEVVGLYREQKIFQEKKAKPGDSFRYRHYEPSINYVVGVAVRVKDEEEVEIDKVKQKLLRVEAVPDSIAGVQLPVTVFWLDKDLAVVQSRVEMAGLGKLVMTRSTKEAALRPVTPALISDVGVMQLIPLNKKIPGVHDTRSVVYKITLPGDENPATAIAVDARQKVENAEGKSFELHVRALRQPKPAKDPAPAAEEFLKSNYFINCDDEKVRELAKTAAGTEKDPWKKALKVERWVHAHMKSTNFTEAMATADHVARTLEGDCTEYAMLTAAMCRAEGVPSRTALGVVYAEVDKGKVHGPVLAYHMWTEVYVDGQWLAVDATLGRGGIGAGHIKITDHSWHDQRSLAPLLPVMRVMLAKPVIEVEQVEPESAPRRKEAGQ